MWIEVSEGNWLNVSKVGRVWLQASISALGRHGVYVLVDGTASVVFTSEDLSDAKGKVLDIVDACQELSDGRETWKQADAAPNWTKWKARIAAGER